MRFKTIVYGCRVERTSLVVVLYDEAEEAMRDCVDIEGSDK